MGPGMVLAGYPVCTPPGPPVLPAPRVHPCWPGGTSPATSRCAARRNMVVGLISVAQLTLRALFSDISLMTEVYNLLEIDNR